ncbi:DNA (cytosine-5)-methyltransferase CMT3-like [Carex rostrata]
MEPTATPVSEKRQLRQRKPPQASPSSDQEEEEVRSRGLTKRRKTTSRSVKKEKDMAAQPSNGVKGKARSGSKGKGKEKSKKKTRSVVKGDTGGEQIEEENEDEMVDEEEAEKLQEEVATEPRKRVFKLKQSKEVQLEAQLVGDPIDDTEARKKWPHRYTKTTETGSSENIRARRHFTSANVDGTEFELYNDAYVKAEDGMPDYICRIVELFEGVDRKAYFTAQWFFRAEDTVLKQCSDKQDKRRLFLSDDKNDNPLDCIGAKLKIVRVEPNIDLAVKQKTISECDYYYDMSYVVAYSTFANLSREIDVLMEESTSNISFEIIDPEPLSSEKKSLHLLDLYSGCGGMSTGLCLGAALSGVNLETSWAVDFNSNACESLQTNHPRTQVRNEKAENFLALIKEWKKLVEEYNVQNEHTVDASGDLEDSDSDDDDGTKLPKDVFEVAKLLNICYGDPHNIGIVGIKFLVRWKGYGPADDTWEPIGGLCEAKEKVREFVVNGYKRNILPLPGTVDVICGGPPCQGISGFNRFRNAANPFGDDKNVQMQVYMEIVEYLKPRYVLMENVVDILKFSKGFLGRYALGRLVEMNYQARLGLMVAGCYGLPQFRMRAFLFGALPTEVLPQFPLPTHNVVIRGNVPQEFALHVVALDENADRSVLKPELFLGDAISDLPPVPNNEPREEMSYGEPPQTEFQQYIRLSRKEMLDHSFGDVDQEPKLLDHQPLKLNDDDYARVCQIPKRKGANFRDLAGVKVGPDNVCYLDKDITRPLLPSGKPLVPDYAVSHLKGKSEKCFGRLWWDQTVPTVVTRAEPHNQTILHPVQDRVLTIRENARLQGFPDYYKFSGPLKERYMQVGNAVAVPVGRALGVGLGRALQKIPCDNGPVFTLPSNFLIVGQPQSSSEVEQ